VDPKNGVECLLSITRIEKERNWAACGLSVLSRYLNVYSPGVKFSSSDVVKCREGEFPYLWFMSLQIVSVGLGFLCSSAVSLFRFIVIISGNVAWLISQSHYWFVIGGWNCANRCTDC